MRNAEPIWDHVDAHRDDLIGLADRVWGMPETLYNEYRSCAQHTEMLRQKGFAVTEEVAGIPTAVMGESGEGGPVIAILGEYDALPGLSQEANVAYPQPLEVGGNGHGCGHNLLGSAALLAACALKDWLAETGTPGRVRYYGCPAEEGGAAKTFMVRAGVFEDVDAAICWHPAPMTKVTDPHSLEALDDEGGRRGWLPAFIVWPIALHYLWRQLPHVKLRHHTSSGNSLRIA